MTQDEAVVELGGWRLGVGMVRRQTAARDDDFHAIYSGADFGNIRRGILAIVAHCDNGHGAAALAAHGLAEGYFGASETLSPARAAGNALAVISNWLHDQARTDENLLGASVALSAIVCTGSRIGVIHVGDCRAYRLRGAKLLALTEDHVRRGDDGLMILSRAIGGDRELHVDYQDETVETHDRLLLLSSGCHRSVPEQAIANAAGAALAAGAAARKLTELTGTNAGGGESATAVVIDVLAVPEAAQDDIALIFADLPLRTAPHAGDDWDGFIIGEVLYRSRYTVVHVAEDRIERRTVVVKIPLPGIADDQVFRAGFLRETWIGTKIDSPWIAEYIAVPPARQTSLYLVMRHYQGETLETRLSRPDPVGLVEGVGITVKLCSAVRDLARRQVIHRDLKPENVMLPADGGLRLLDLGIAYLPGLDAPGQARLGGTTRYLAPELFQGIAANQRTEVFALGVTVYRMFSGGRFPFGQREAFPLARNRPDLPPWIGRCIARAIDPNSRRRFPDAEAFGKALDAGLALGDWDPAGEGRSVWWRDSVRLWQALAMALAIACMLLLLRVVRGGA